MTPRLHETLSQKPVGAPCPAPGRTRLPARAPGHHGGHGAVPQHRARACRGDAGGGARGVGGGDGEVTQVAGRYARYLQREADLGAARELLADPGMAELAQEEIDSSQTE